MMFQCKQRNKNVEDLAGGEPASTNLSSQQTVVKVTTQFHYVEYTIQILYCIKYIYMYKASKVSSYILQYPVLRTDQNTFHFIL